MKSTSSLALLTALGLLAGTPLAGQQERGQSSSAQKPAQARTEAPVFVRARIGANAAMLDAEGQPLGTVQDQVIDRQTGVIKYIAVEIKPGADAARTVAVPYESFAFNETERQLRLGMNSEALKALTEFDAKRIRGMTKRGGEAREAAAQKKEAPKLILGAML